MKRNHQKFVAQSESYDCSEKLLKARGVKKVKRNFLITYPKGHKFTANDQSIILHIFHQLETNKSFEPLRSSNTYELTALLFGCCLNTVKKVVKSNGEYPDQRKGRILETKEIPIKYKEVFIDKINTSRELGRRCTTRHFQVILRAEDIFVSESTVLRKLKEWGLKFGTLNEKDSRRKQQAVLDLRTKYLQDLIELEQAGFSNRVYLDESFIYQNCFINKGWYNPSDGREIYKLSGLGKRIAIAGAITQTSWLGIRPQNLKTCLSKSIDSIHSYKGIKYWEVKDCDDPNQGNINAPVFNKYFQENVLANLAEPSIIILDNAKYHKAFPEGHYAPKQSDKKEVLRRFLEDHGENVEESELKPDLLQRAKKLYVELNPLNEIQNRAEEAGHRVLYLPPYHPELNPVEYGWADLKRYASEQAPGDIYKLCSETIPEAFKSVTSLKIQNMFSHVRKQEEFYRHTRTKEQDGTLLINDLDVYYEVDYD